MSIPETARASREQVRSLSIGERQREHRRDDEHLGVLGVARAGSIASSRVSARSVRRSIEERSEALGGGPEEDDEPCDTAGLGTCLLEQRLFLRRGVDRQPAFSSSPPATRTTDPGACFLSADAVFAGVAAMPSSISSVAPSLPTRVARNGGTCGGPSCSGSAPAASVVAAAARRAWSRGVETRRRAERPFADGVAQHDLVPVDERARVDLAGRGEAESSAERSICDRRGRRVALVHHDDVVGTLPPDDRLLRRSIALERAVQLEVVGPEA